jgi:hypothetical protein
MATKSELELPPILTGSSIHKQRSGSVVQLSQFYANLNLTLLGTNQETRNAFVDQDDSENTLSKGSRSKTPEIMLPLCRTNTPDKATAIARNKTPEPARAKTPEKATAFAQKSNPEPAIADLQDTNSTPYPSKKSYLKMQALSLATDKQKKSVHVSPKSFIAEQFKVHSESPIFQNYHTGEEGRSKEGEAPIPSFQKVKTSAGNANVIRWKRQEFPSEDAYGNRHDIIALTRWLNSMYSKIPACKAWPPSVSDEEMSTAFERFLSTFSKDIYLNSTHPECLNAIIKSSAEFQKQQSWFEYEQPIEKESPTPDEVLMPFRASIEIVDAVAGEIIRQISSDCSERALLLDKVITQYKVVLREAWIMKQRAETEGISGLRSLIKQCEELLISESKARVVAECSNEHHVIKAQANERKIQSCEKELTQCNIQLSRLRDQIEQYKRQLHEKDNTLECTSLFLKDARASCDVKQLLLENVLMRERQWEEKVRAMGADPNCFLGIDVEIQADMDSFKPDPSDILRLVTPPEVRKIRIERDAYAQSLAQMKRAEAAGLGMKDLSKKAQPVAAFRQTIVTQVIEDKGAQKEKELLAQKLKEKETQQLSLLNQTQQKMEAYKAIQDELALSKQEVAMLKDSIKAAGISLAESEAQRKKSEADVLILLEENDALQKKHSGSSEESIKIEEEIREAKASLFKEQLMVKKLEEELQSWKENETRISKELATSKEHSLRQKLEIQNLNTKLIVVERDLSLMTIQLKKMQYAAEENGLIVAAVAAVAVVCSEIACQTEQETPLIEKTKLSPDKQKKTFKGAALAVEATSVAISAPSDVDEGPTHEKIKKATLQLRADLKKKTEENLALMGKLKDLEEKVTIHQATFAEKLGVIASLQAERAELFEKTLKLRSDLEIACRPPAPSEKVVDAVAALQVIGALTQMHHNSNQHEVTEKLKRQMNSKEHDGSKPSLANMMEKPKTPSRKTPLLPTVVATRIQVVDEANGDGMEEIHAQNRDQVLKLLAAAQGIGKATKKFHRQIKLSDDNSEENNVLELEARLQAAEEKCVVLTQYNESLRGGNATKAEEINRLNSQIHALKDELAMIAEQRANWLKDEQKRNHLETSIQSATQQTKVMMESMKGNAFRAAVILQVDKSKRPILSADDGLLPATDSQIVSNYVPKPEISQASIPYLKFLSGDKIQTAKNPKSDEWLNNFFEDLMSCKVCT